MLEDEGVREVADDYMIVKEDFHQMVQAEQ
jgi:hypothetical protein